MSALVVAFSACEANPVTPEEVVEWISITPSHEVFHAVPGDTMSIEGAAQTNQGRFAVRTWEALDPEVATVDENAKITVHAEGQARFVGRYKDVADTAAVEIVFSRPRGRILTINGMDFDPGSRFAIADSFYTEVEVTVPAEAGAVVTSAFLERSTMVLKNGEEAPGTIAGFNRFVNILPGQTDTVQVLAYGAPEGEYTINLYLRQESTDSTGATVATGSRMRKTYQPVSVTQSDTTPPVFLEIVKWEDEIYEYQAKIQDLESGTGIISAIFGKDVDGELVFDYTVGYEWARDTLGRHEPLPLVIDFDKKNGVRERGYTHMVIQGWDLAYNTVVSDTILIN